jgi:hypothetical protein
MKQKALYLILGTLLFCVSCGSSHKRVSVPTDSNAKVWVCTGSSSKRYHAYDNCKGLSKCRASVDEVTLEEAESMGRTPCRKCYKK